MSFHYDNIPVVDDGRCIGRHRVFRLCRGFAIAFHWGYPRVYLFHKTVLSVG